MQVIGMGVWVGRAYLTPCAGVHVPTVVPGARGSRGSRGGVQSSGGARGRACRQAPHGKPSHVHHTSHVLLEPRDPHVPRQCPTCVGQVSARHPPLSDLLSTTCLPPLLSTLSLLLTCGHPPRKTQRPAHLTDACFKDMGRACAGLGGWPRRAAHAAGERRPTAAQQAGQAGGEPSRSKEAARNRRGQTNPWICTIP